MKDPTLATSTSVNNCCIYFLFIGNLSLTAVPLYLLPPRLTPAICGGNRLHVSVNCCPRRDFAQKAKFRGGSLVPSPSLLIRSPRKVWERAGERTRFRLGECLSVTSQLMVESRNDRAENTWGLDCRGGTLVTSAHSKESTYSLNIQSAVSMLEKSRFARRGATRNW